MPSTPTGSAASPGERHGAGTGRWSAPPDPGGARGDGAIRPATKVTLNEAERRTLEALAGTAAPLQERARIVLLAADGMASRAIARTLGCSAGTASKWRARFARAGMAALRDAAPRYGAQQAKRILAMLDRPPPDGQVRWTGPLLARALGDVPEQYIWRILRGERIVLADRPAWRHVAPPEFAAKATDIAGLYLWPPDHALVLAVGEPLPPKAARRSAARAGTSSPLAALAAAAQGTPAARHDRRRRRGAFRDFLAGIAARHADKTLHVILDGPSGRGPVQSAWLRRHPHVHLHAMPTHAGWLAQLEVWFAILAGPSSSARLRDLVARVDGFIADYGEGAPPLLWTKDAPGREDAVRPRADAPLT